VAQVTKLLKVKLNIAKYDFKTVNIDNPVVNI
jgi:hypothetical protein